MADNQYKCSNCQMVITKAGGGSPDKKAGGPCPKNSNGEHSWWSHKG